MNRIARRNDEGEDVSEGCSDEDSSFAASDEEECSDKKNTKVSLHQQHTRSVDRSFEVGHGNDNADDDSRSGEREFLDATIKLVRLLANLSIDADIGSALGARLDTLEVCKTDTTTSITVIYYLYKATTTTSVYLLILPLLLILLLLS